MEKYHEDFFFTSNIFKKIQGDMVGELGIYNKQNWASGGPLYTSAGARSMLNRKCSSIPDRRKKIDEKYFFIMEKKYFENFGFEKNSKIFFRKIKKIKTQNFKI